MSKLYSAAYIGELVKVEPTDKYIKIKRMESSIYCIKISGFKGYNWYKLSDIVPKQSI